MWSSRKYFMFFGRICNADVRSLFVIMENILLENTLIKASQTGYEEAYQYLSEEFLKLPEGEYPRVVYFLMCLAAGSGKNEIALRYDFAYSGGMQFENRDFTSAVSLYSLYERK